MKDPLANNFTFFYLLFQIFGFVSSLQVSTSFQTGKMRSSFDLFLTHVLISIFFVCNK